MKAEFFYVFFILPIHQTKLMQISPDIASFAYFSLTNKI